MLALVLDPDSLAADLTVDDGTLRREDGLATAVAASLLSDRRARPDDPLPDPRRADRRGWWGDALADIEGDRWGSRLWLLSRARQSEETRRRAIEYAEEALAWLRDEGRVTAIAVTAEWAGRGVLALRVGLTLPDDGDESVTVPVQTGGA
jgi:phage gp46-like protein